MQYAYKILKKNSNNILIKDKDVNFPRAATFVLQFMLKINKNQPPVTAFHEISLHWQTCTFLL